MESVKPNARQWCIPEQIVRDPISGLTLQFDVLTDGECRLRIFGAIPFGNREIGWVNGEKEWSGCSVSKAGWIGTRE